MRFLKNRPKLMGFLLAISLSACAGATVIGAGCNAYAEARVTLPWEAFAKAPVEATRWLNLLDVRMSKVCTNG